VASGTPERTDLLERIVRRRTALLKLPPDHGPLRRPRLDELEGVPLWTDDDSDLLSVLRAH
jgi:hypothetical protein